ncbi:OmpP1/FadL family transporter, partial [Desulfoplanes sp.]
DWLAFGASYRSKIEVKMKGDVDFSNIGDKAVAGNKADTFGQAYGDSFKATEPLPAMLSLGILVKPLDKLSLSFDLLRTYWSAYDELRIEMTDSTLTPPKNPIVKEKNWKDVNRYQIGLEYALYDWMDLRLGYVYDESPVDPDHAEYQIPSNDRQIYSIGSGFHWDTWTIDVAYSYLTVKDRNFDDSTATGVKDSTFEDGNSHIVALNVGYRF